MFKRFQVMDLFDEGENLDVKEWRDAKKELPEKDQAIYKVRLENGNEKKAYFCQDKCYPLCQYIKVNPSYWWDRIEKVPLDDVVYWGKT
jgi:hypothetical protein